MTSLSFKGMDLNTFIIPIIILITSILIAGYFIVFKNLSAKDLVFSYTTLCAASVMFLLNIFLSLNNSEKSISIHSLIYYNDKKADIYVPFSKSGFIIDGRDEIISTILDSKQCSNIPKAPSDSCSEILEEFYKIAYVGHLITSYPDWSPTVERFMSREITNYKISNDGSGNSKFIPNAEFLSQLDISDKILEITNRTSISEGVTLPPKTKLFSGKNYIAFENEFSILKISFKVARSFTRTTPEDYLAKRPIMISEDVSNKPYISEALITFKFIKKKQRSGNSDMQLYEDWLLRLAEDARKSFSLPES